MNPETSLSSKEKVKRIVNRSIKVSSSILVTSNHPFAINTLTSPIRFLSLYIFLIRLRNEVGQVLRTKSTVKEEKRRKHYGIIKVMNYTYFVDLFASRSTQTYAQIIKTRVIARYYFIGIVICCYDFNYALVWERF